MVSLNKSVLCRMLLCCYQNVLYLEKNSARVCCWIKQIVVVSKQLREQPGGLSFLRICRKLVCILKACCLNLVLIAKAPYPGPVPQNGAGTALLALPGF